MEEGCWRVTVCKTARSASSPRMQLRSLGQYHNVLSRRHALTELDIQHRFYHMNVLCVESEDVGATFLYNVADLHNRCALEYGYSGLCSAQNACPDAFEHSP